MKTIKLISLLAFCLLGCNSKFTHQKLNGFFEEINEHQMAMGSIAISQDGKLLYQKAFGDAILEDSLSTIETNYRIGSVSKLFTSVLIFQLIEEEKLSLDETIDLYISGIPNGDKITIRHLLSHRSGLANYTENEDFDRWRFVPKSKQELLAVLRNLPLEFELDEKAKYANSNYLLLSFIVEEVYQKSYQGVLEERVISKLNLVSTYFEVAADSTLKKSKSYKYANGAWVVQREDVAANHLGAGAIVSTQKDLTVFMDALFSGQLITDKSLAQMTSIKEEFGMGIFPFTIASQRGFGHEGRINEYHTSLLYFPDTKSTVAYCTNGILYPRDDIMAAVVKMIENRPFEIPIFEGLEHGRIKTYLGEYASEFMPIKVEVKSRNGKLIVETQGVEFELEKVSEHYFMNKKQGFFFEFKSTENELQIKETDNVYYLKKE